MIINDVSWYLVRNTRGVTGFVGPGSKPVPLSAEEVKDLGGVQDVVLPSIDLKEKDAVKVTAGPFESFMGTVESINLEKKEGQSIYIYVWKRDSCRVGLDQIEKL